LPEGLKIKFKGTYTQIGSKKEKYVLKLDLTIMLTVFPER